jgi:L-2-hydroxycarboxylate dehydrogenase (NAD+)
MAIDLSAFGDVAAFKERVDQLVRDLRTSERMPGVERIWLPGEQSHERRITNRRDGIALPVSLRSQLDAFAAEMGMPKLQDTSAIS